MQQEIYDCIDNRMIRKYSYQTHIAELHKKKLSFKETCFIRIPTKSQRELKDMHIVVAMQAPEFVGSFSGLNNLSIDQILERPDLISFRTIYIAEIALFDRKTKSIITSDWIKNPTIYKFN